MEEHEFRQRNVLLDWEMEDTNRNFFLFLEGVEIEEDTWITLTKLRHEQSETSLIYTAKSCKVTLKMLGSMDSLAVNHSGESATCKFLRTKMGSELEFEVQDYERR